MDPWTELANIFKDALDAVDGIGQVHVGEQYATHWDRFLDLFVYEPGGGADPVVQGWQIVEPGQGYVGSGETLDGGFMTDILAFQFRGFVEMGGDPDAGRDAFRNLAWTVKKTLDAMQSFSLTDDAIEYTWSFPSSVSTVQPMVFGELDCWACDITKQVNVHRRNV